MPVSLATIYRGVILLGIIAHVMYMYGTARVMAESVGFQYRPTLIGVGFALAMVIPLFFAAGLPELPDVLTHRRRERRWAKQQCTRCGYDLAGSARSDRPRCPECGAMLADPGGYQFSWHTLRRFAVMSVFGWLLGCTACEAILLYDEWRFGQEVETRGVDTPWSRGRLWPFETASLVHLPGEPTHATD